MTIYKYWYHAKERGPVTLGEVHTDTIELETASADMTLITLEVKKLGRTLLRYEKFKPTKDWFLAHSIPDNRYQR